MSHHIYNLGFIHGRFQPFHKGHDQLVQYLKIICKQVLVLIGSSQKSGTELNPFTFEERRELILKCHTDVVVLAAPDLGKGINSLWGDHLIHIIQNSGFKIPEITLSSEDTRLREIFLNYPQIRCLIMPRHLELSASYIRNQVYQQHSIQTLLPEKLFNVEEMITERILKCRSISDQKILIKGS